MHRAEGTTQRFSRANRVALQRGDLLRLVTANGGGWGKAEDRALAAIESDVLAGLVSHERAMTDYPQYRALVARKGDYQPPR
ncbi:MAG: hypothetical protein ACRER5_02545 [Pseudomonas sp.]